MFRTMTFAAIASAALLTATLADARPRMRMGCEQPDASIYSVCLGGAALGQPRSSANRNSVTHVSVEEAALFERASGGSTATGGGAGGGGGGGGGAGGGQ